MKPATLTVTLLSSLAAACAIALAFVMRAAGGHPFITVALGIRLPGRDQGPVGLRHHLGEALTFAAPGVAVGDDGELAAEHSLIEFERGSCLAAGFRDRGSPGAETPRAGR